MPVFRGQTIRDDTVISATFPSGSPTSTKFEVPYHAAGAVWLPSAFTGFGLGLCASPSADGTYTIMRDASNGYGIDVSNVLPTAQLTSTFCAHTPPLWFGAQYGQLMAHNGTGSGIPQTSARVVVLTFKS